MEAAEYRLMDGAEDIMWWYRALHLRLLGALAGVRGSVLDAGCGTGGFLRRLQSERPDLRPYGVDFNADAAARAAAKSGAEVTCASVECLPFAAHTFDAVVSADVLCHRSVDPAVALAEAARVLKPSGVLIINMPAHQWLRSTHDTRVQTARRTNRATLRAWLDAAGLARIDAHYWNSLLLPAMFLHRKVVARRPDAGSDVKLFPPALDRLLWAVTEVERRAPFAFPAGGSVMATAHAR
jgi:SAM-dependent methyltransferase